MSAVFEVPVQLLLALLLALGEVPAGATPDQRSRNVAASDFLVSDERWLARIRRHGPTLGLETLSRRIFVTNSGRTYVPIAAERRAILAFRNDPVVAGRVLREAARFDAQVFQNVMGRPPSAAELMLAWIAGVEASISIAEAAGSNGSRAVAALVPDAALRLPRLFFDGRSARDAGSVLRMAERALEQARRRLGAMKAASKANGSHWATVVSVWR